MMEKKLSIPQAFNIMALYLTKNFERTLSEDVGLLVSELQLFEEGGTWDPAAWEDWMEGITQILKESQEQKRGEDLSISEAFNAMILYLKKYYELTSYDDIGIILNKLVIFDKDRNTESIIWKDWLKCVDKVLYENYQHLGSFKNI